MTSEGAKPGAADVAAPGVAPEGTMLRRTAAGWTVAGEDVPDLTCAMVLADLIAAEMSAVDPEPSRRGAEPGAAGAAADSTASAGKAAAGPAAGGSAPGDASGAGAGGHDRQPDAGAAAGGTGATGPGSAVAAVTGAAAAAATGDKAASASADDGQDEARRLRITVSQLERALAVRIRVEQAIGVLAERHRIRPRQAFERLRSAARGRGQRVVDIAGDVIASATNPLLQLPEELSRPSLAPRQRSIRRRARDAQ